MKYLSVAVTVAVALLAASVFYMKLTKEAIEVSSVKDEDTVAAMLSLKASNQQLSQEIIALRTQIGELSQKFEKK